MVNLLTYFANLHAHSSIKHTLRNSRVTGTIVNKNEETAQHFISVFCWKQNAKTFQCWRCYPRVVFFHKINRTCQLFSLYNQLNKYLMKRWIFWNVSNKHKYKVHHNTYVSVKRMKAVNRKYTLLNRNTHLADH